MQNSSDKPIRNRNSNSLFQGLIILGDFIILNVIIYYLALLLPGFSDKIDERIKVYMLICNTSMVIAEFLIPPIIHLRYLNPIKVITRIFKLTLIQSLLSYIIFRLLFGSGGMFNAILIHSTILFCAISSARGIERLTLEWYRKRGGNTRNIIFVGNDPANVMVYKELINNQALGYNPIGYYSNGTIEDGLKSMKKLGTLEDLYMITSGKKPGDNHPDEIFCSISHDETILLRSIMKYCDKNIIHFYYVPRILGSINLGLGSERLGDFTLYTSHKTPLENTTNMFIKRIFDVVFSSIVCLVLLPFIPIIAIIIKLQSPGPIFFSQERTGFNGKTFKCIKFRSMHVNNGSDTVQTTKNDPRKFPFGNFMRKSNVDELPQFFNVLRGDMSIVGPRPHMLYHTKRYSDLIDKYMVRHFSKPGITGYAQVTGFRGETKELWQMEERVKRDIWYIENWSFWLDIKIIFQTAVSIIKKDKNAY